MNKLDLIIECMDQILNDELPSPEKMMTAYRYAHELKALQPVAWQNLHLPDEFYDAETLDPSWHFHYRPLYALDEVKHD